MPDLRTALLFFMAKGDRRVSRLTETPCGMIIPSTDFRIKRLFIGVKPGCFFNDLKEIGKDLRVLYISGGEPLLMQEWQTFLKHLVKTGDAGARHFKIELQYHRPAGGFYEGYAEISED